MTKQICEATDNSSPLFQLSATGGRLPYKFSILSAEFLTYVELENEGVTQNDEEGVNVFLKPDLKFDREVCHSCTDPQCFIAVNKYDKVSLFCHIL